MNDGNPNTVAAAEAAQKFEFYFLALVFTALGLSIQTVGFYRWGYQFLFELLSWAALLVSGLAGLLRLHWVPVAYRVIAHIQDQEGRLNIFNKAESGGGRVEKVSGGIFSSEEISAEKEELNRDILTCKGKLKKIEKRLQLKYEIHKWAFFGGLVSLVISRAIAGLIKAGVILI